MIFSPARNGCNYPCLLQTESWRSLLIKPREPSDLTVRLSQGIEAGSHARIHESDIRKDQPNMEGIVVNVRTPVRRFKEAFERVIGISG